MIRVMLVDDEQYIPEGLKVLIDWKKEGCEIVKIASNGMEAYEYLKRNRVDLIIADIQMPIMTGLELLEKIRTEEISNAFFVILSGYSDFEYAQKALRYTCLDYLLKPVQRDSLIKIIARVADEKGIKRGEAENAKSKQRGVLDKKFLDNLVAHIAVNDEYAINNDIEILFGQLGITEMTSELLEMHANYLMVRLTQLAVEQDPNVDQNYVMEFLEEGLLHAENIGTKSQIRRFAVSFAEYITQLRRNTSRGVIADIEKYIREHFAENITLTDLGKKYFLNSSYLGQLFRKQYGQSFKDYLCEIRINEAASRLINSDMKIAQIADNVGYKDADYFVEKFIEIKGCTPARYRKQRGEI